MQDGRFVRTRGRCKRAEKMRHRAIPGQSQLGIRLAVFLFESLFLLLRAPISPCTARRRGTPAEAESSRDFYPIETEARGHCALRSRNRCRKQPLPGPGYAGERR